MMCFLKKFQSGPCFKGEEGKKSEIYEFQCTRASSIKMIMTSSCSPSAKASKVNLNIQGISLMPFDLSGNLVIPRNCQYIPSANTLFEIFIFCPKIQLWLPEKIVDFLGWKTRENVVVLDFLAVDNFDFTRKIVKKKFGRKTFENVGGFVKIEFLDKNLTFRIVCSLRSLTFGACKGSWVLCKGAYIKNGTEELWFSIISTALLA